jgi:hypothetical protein
VLLGLASLISRDESMEFSPGDLVEVTKKRSFRISESEICTGIIISGRPTSLYVEARPYKIIDEVIYKIISGGEGMFAYGYQIRKLND